MLLRGIMPSLVLPVFLYGLAGSLQAAPIVVDPNWSNWPTVPAATMDMVKQGWQQTSSTWVGGDPQDFLTGGQLAYAYVGMMQSGTKGGTFGLPKFVNPDPDRCSLEGVILVLIGTAKNGRNVVDSKSEWADPLVTVRIGAKITCRTDLTEAGSSNPLLQAMVNPTAETTGSLLPHDPLAPQGPPSPRTDPVLVDLYSSYADRLVAKIGPQGETASDSATLARWLGNLDLSAFEGTGEVLFRWDGQPHQYNNAHVDADAWTVAPEYEFQASVLYLYVMPEPASLAMIGAGLVPLLLKRRRKGRR